MNGFSTLMIIFGICVFFVGLYMYTGHELKVIAWKAAFKGLNKDGWKKVGKYTMLSSILIFTFAVIGIIFNFE